MTMLIFFSNDGKAVALKRTDFLLLLMVRISTIYNGGRERIIITLPLAAV